MPTVYIGSIITSLTKGLAANSTQSTLVVADSRPTTTAPAASATRTLITRQLGATDKPSIRVYPYGGNANNDVVNVKLLGWKLAGTSTGVSQWISTVIAEVSATLSSALLGNALAPILTTEFLADTLSLTSGIAVLYTGTADVDAASFVCDISQFEIITIDGSMGAGGDAVNWLYCH